MKKIIKPLAVILLVCTLAVVVIACSPYVGLDLSVPFHVGKVRVDPGIHVGIPLGK